MIADCDIPGADPAAVVAQYEPYIQKLTKRYLSVLSRSGAVGIDDLMQCGRIAVLRAQQNYDPEKGPFLNLLYYEIRRSMRAAVGINESTGTAPAQMVYLDEPIITDEGGEISRGDLIPDPDILPFDEPLIENETRKETAEQIRAALERMKSDKQRNIIQRVYLDGESKQKIADETGVNISAIRSLDIAARNTLRRDFWLKKYAAEQYPLFFVSVAKFNTTWISATEAAVFWRLDHVKGTAPERDKDGE